DHARQARLAGGLEEPRHVEVRADPDPRRRIVGTDIREQEQHQQRAATRGHVHTPGREVVPLARIAILSWEADVDMPAGVTWVVRMRKPNHEDPELLAWTPASLADELIERI